MHFLSALCAILLSSAEKGEKGYCTVHGRYLARHKGTLSMSDYALIDPLHHQRLRFLLPFIPHQQTDFLESLAEHIKL